MGGVGALRVGGGPASGEAGFLREALGAGERGGCGGRFGVRWRGALGPGRVCGGFAIGGGGAGGGSVRRAGWSI